MRTRRSPKTRWRFTRAGGDWFCFAGLLGRGKDGEAFTLLTTDAGPDVAPIHNRQPVVLDREAWAAWLGGDAGLLGPSPAGSLVVVESPRTRSKPGQVSPSASRPVY
ncbi:MAG TPA: SOS response-associated peptidase family protein [Acetobacteraceae bacterium]